MSTAPLIDLATAKARLRITSSTDDDLVTRVVAAVTERIEELVGPVIQRGPTVELHDGGTRTVRLRLRPAAAVATVEERLPGVSTWTTLVENTAYFLDEHDGDAVYTGVVRRHDAFRTACPFPVGIAAVRVTYTPGRFTSQGSVTTRYIEACGITLENWWGQYRPTLTIERGDGFEEPRQQFPRFAVPQAALELLGLEVIGAPDGIVAV